MFKRIHLSSLCFLFFASWMSLAATAQNPPSTADKSSGQFWQQADTLRPKLDIWKNSIDSFDFNQLKAGDKDSVILHTLEGDKQQCLHSLTTLWLQIPNVEKMQGVSLEVRTTLQIVFLHNQLVKLQSDLNIAFAQALASGSMTFNDLQSQTVRGWSDTMSQIAVDLGNHFLDPMQMQMTRHLTLLDVELAQCKSQKSSNP